MFNLSVNISVLHCSYRSQLRALALQVANSLFTEATPFSLTLALTRKAYMCLHLSNHSFSDIYLTSLKEGWGGH